ncbi:MAG: SPOR domain-containing protein [Candidatus Kryptoniota bacterium]
MGNLNFQDEHDGSSQQAGTPAREAGGQKSEDLIVDEATAGTKFLWIALVVIVIAGIGGGLYLLNKYGYLNFSSKHQAEAVVNESTSVPPEDKSATPANAQAAPTGKFALQVSAFRTEALADNFAAKLRTKGIDAYVFAGDAPNDGKWFKVCVGSFDTKLRAIAATEEMKRKVGTDVWVVPAQ